MAGSGEYGDEASGSIKCGEFLAYDVLASQEGLCSMELVSYDGERAAALASLTDVSGYLNNLSNELQGTATYDSIKAFKVKLRLWRNLSKLHNILYLAHPKSRDTIYHERI